MFGYGPCFHTPCLYAWISPSFEVLALRGCSSASGLDWLCRAWLVVISCMTLLTLCLPSRSIFVSVLVSVIDSLAVVGSVSLFSLMGGRQSDYGIVSHPGLLFGRVS